MKIVKLCRLFGYSKQASYKRLNSTTAKDFSEVKSLVIAIRCQLPRCGGRKLYHMISNELKVRGVKMGRDKLFSYLRSENLLVPKRRIIIRQQTLNTG